MFVSHICPPGSGSGSATPETDSGTPLKSGYNPDPDGNPDPLEKSFLFLSAGCFLLRTEDFSWTYFMEAKG